MNALTLGGMEEVVLGILKEMDTTYSADILTFFERDISQASEFENYGCKIYQVPRMSKGTVEFIRNCRQLIHQNQYTHIFTMIDMGGILACLSALGTGTKVICASYTNKSLRITNVFIQKSIQYLFRFLPCTLISDTVEAGAYLFGTGKKNVTIIPDGFDISKYVFKDQVRKNVRKQYSVENKLVVGNIGRLVLQKNPEKQLDVFLELLKKHPASEYWMIGGGELQESVEIMIKERQLGKHVKLFGFQKNIDELLQAMDVFLFPSYQEGFGIALAKAQCCGLLCLASDCVPQESNLSGTVHYLKLDDSNQIWADTILKEIKNHVRIDQTEKVRKAGYDCKSTYKQYLKLME